MTMLPLTADEVLTTTRSVRRRLDLTRPVETEVLEECLRIAQQAPNGSNAQVTQFIVVRDPERRAALAECFRKGHELYRNLPFAVYNLEVGDPEHAASLPRIAASLDYLAEHLHEVPVHVVACIPFRTDGQPAALQAGIWGSVLPALWSFMLAARSRGLASCWTTMHLFYEREAAAVLDIPHAEVMQAALVPVAYSLGTDFKPAHRLPLDHFVHWDAYQP